MLVFSEGPTQHATDKEVYIFVDTAFGHVSMISKSIDRQNKAVVFGLQGELPMKMVADGGGVGRD